MQAMVTIRLRCMLRKRKGQSDRDTSPEPTPCHDYKSIPWKLVPEMKQTGRNDQRNEAHNDGKSGTGPRDMFGRSEYYVNLDSHSTTFASGAKTCQMRTKPISSIIFLLLFCTCGKDKESTNCGIEINENTKAQNISILFIGTSHTFYNEMPALVSSVARSLGDSAYTEMSAPGGYDFERHYKLEATITALDSRKWDYIILQESGWRTALPPSLAEVSIYPFADSLKNLIRKNNPTAKLILYMTNGYTNGVNTFGDTAWCNADPQVCTYEGMLDRIKANYIRLAEQLNAEVAPCGLIWKALKARNSSLALHDADGIHPSPTASYANAITLYSIVRKRRMTAVFIPSAVAKDQAILIQKTISEILFDCNPSWKDL